MEVCMPGTGLHRALQGTQQMARVPHSGEERKVAMHGIYEISETREAVQRARVEGLGVTLRSPPFKVRRKGQASWGP